MINWEAIGAVAEMLGAAGVIITLAYLAVQIRQSTRSQRTENYGRALDRVATLQGRMSESSELADIMLRGTQNVRSLSPSERVRFAWMFYEMFTGFEFIFHQAQSRAMPAEVWLRWGDTLRWWMSFPGVQQWWEARPAPFTSDFTAFVDKQASAAPANDETQARWVHYMTDRDE